MIDKLKNRFVTGAFITDAKHYFSKINEIIDWSNNSETSKYKVYTALLTQSGGDELMTLYVGPSYGGTNLTIGVSYTILDNGVTADFRNIGAPNNNIGTSFVATGEIPLNRGDDNTSLSYNVGAPVVTVLENTIGNIVWSYLDVGNYIGTLTGAFNDKTIIFLGYDFNNLEIGYTARAINGNTTIDSIDIQTNNNASVYANDVLYRTPIEIRIYN